MPLTQKEISDVNDIGVVRQEVLENMRQNVATWIELVKYQQDRDIDFTLQSERIINDAVTFFEEEIEANLETIESFRRMTRNISNKAKVRDAVRR